MQFEEITGKVPRNIMKLLRDHVSNPVEWLEKSIIGQVRAAVDAGDFTEVSALVKIYDLNTAFEIIGDPIK